MKRRMFEVIVLNYNVHVVAQYPFPPKDFPITGFCGESRFVGCYCFASLLDTDHDKAQSGIERMRGSGGGE